MLQKELAKRLKARYDTKMDGNGWLEVSSDGIPLCRIKYNGQFLSNADQNLSDEYRSKIADIQDEISTVVRIYSIAVQAITSAAAVSTGISIVFFIYAAPYATLKRRLSVSLVNRAASSGIAFFNAVVSIRLLLTVL